MIEHFHFLRPLWLLALIPLIIFSGLLIRRSLFSRNWQSVIDPQLLPHVLIGTAGTASRIPAILFFICGLLGIVALAGPTWNQLPQPVYKAKSALVIALDLSHSMDASDIKPSRLARAHFKINDILKLRKEGDTALIAYAADAFTTIPLTDDSETIANIVNSLTTDIMPAQGSRADRALKKASELLRNAAIAKGHILLITDGIDSTQLDAFSDIASQGHHVSILAIGTPQGSPISLSGGGFLQDNAGNIVVAKTDLDLIRNAASNGNGRFSTLTTDDTDIKHILSFVASDINTDDSEKTDLASDVWQEQGPWLLLLAAPLAALAFRRGLLVLCLLIILPLPQPAHAMGWDALWKNSNQRGAEKLQQEQAAQAAELCSDPQWKAAAHYRAQQYENTVKELKTINTPDAHYNRGNALAKLGKYDEAIKAYEQALDMQADFDDASYNKKLIEDMLQQQQQNPDKQQKDKQNQDKDKQQQASDDKQNSGSSSDDSRQQSDNKSSDKESPKDAEQKSQQQSQQQNAADNDNKQQEQPSADQQAQSDNQKDAQQASEAKQSEQQTAPDDKPQDLSQQATEQWLRKIPDDPGGLLRRKFQYQYRNMQDNQQESNPW